MVKVTLSRAHTIEALRHESAIAVEPALLLDEIDEEEPRHHQQRLSRNRIRRLRRKLLRDLVGGQVDSAPEADEEPARQQLPIERPIDDPLQISSRSGALKTFQPRDGRGVSEIDANDPALSAVTEAEQSEVARAWRFDCDHVDDQSVPLAEGSCEPGDVGYIDGLSAEQEKIDVPLTKEERERRAERNVDADAPPFVRIDLGRLDRISEGREEPCRIEIADCVASDPLHQHHSAALARLSALPWRCDGPTGSGCWRERSSGCTWPTSSTS